MFQTVDINIVPTGDMPVVNVSQYDINRIIRFCLLNDGETYTPTNFLKAEFIIRKVDGTLFTQETTILVSNVLELVTTEQMTACAGKNIGEIRITFNDPDIAEDDVIISTLNFILEVERSPETGGIESESEIANLNGQIAAIVDEQLENYYTKSEIDDQIETIVSEQVTPIVADIVAEQVPPAVQAELTNYYTKDETDTYFYNKTETDTLLSGKADISDLPDMSDYYTKTDTDTLLAGKVSTSTLNDYYTKTQVDTLIAGVGVDITTSIDTPAAVQTFTDGGNNIPLKSCTVAIVATQSGTGIPSPSNPRSISGFSSVAVSVSDGVTPTTTNVSLGQTIYGGTAALVVGSGVKDYGYIEFDGSSDEDWSFASGNKWATITIPDMMSGANQDGITNWLPKSTSYGTFGFAMGRNNNNFYAYQIIDISGVTDLASWKTYLSNNPLQVVYPLSTPTAFTFTGANIHTLSGINNVSADCGDINSLEYFNNKADDIAALITLMNRS